MYVSKVSELGAGESEEGGGTGHEGLGSRNLHPGLSGINLSALTPGEGGNDSLIIYLLGSCAFVIGEGSRLEGGAIAGELDEI